MKTLSKVAALMLILMVALWGVPSGVKADNEPVQAAAQDDETYDIEYAKLDVHVKVYDAIGNDDWEKDVEEASKQFSESHGATEAERTVKVSIFIGKDDGDDDNDGAADGKDSDDYGDGTDDAKQDVEEINLDEQTPEAMKGLPNENKGEGIYIAIEAEGGEGVVLKSAVDSVDNGKDETASALLRRAIFSFQPAGFVAFSNHNSRNEARPASAPNVITWAFCTHQYGIQALINKLFAASVRPYNAATQMLCSKVDLKCAADAYNHNVRTDNAALQKWGCSQRHNEVGVPGLERIRKAATQKATSAQQAQPAQGKVQAFFSLVSKKK